MKLSMTLAFSLIIQERGFQSKDNDVNDRNSVIKAYIALGPCQQRSHNFPVRSVGGKPRCFMQLGFMNLDGLNIVLRKMPHFFV